MDSNMQEKFRVYLIKHKQFLANPLINSFLDIADNKKLLELAVCFPSKENKDALDIAFKKFYINIRLISYLSTALHRRAVDFDKKLKLTNKRFPLTFDQAVPDTNGKLVTYADILTSPADNVEGIALSESQLGWQESVENIELLQAFKRLTPRQQDIIVWAYFHGLKDGEIAQQLNITRQAVTKARNKGLRHLRTLMAGSDRQEMKEVKL